MDAFEYKLFGCSSSVLSGKNHALRLVPGLPGPVVFNMRISYEIVQVVCLVLSFEAP
jgi:hypothetical protein